MVKVNLHFGINKLFATCTRNHSRNNAKFQSTGQRRVNKQSLFLHRSSNLISFTILDYDEQRSIFEQSFSMQKFKFKSLGIIFSGRFK